MAEAQDVGAELQIVSVTLEMGGGGGSGGVVAYLRCEGAASEDFGLCSHFGGEVSSYSSTEILPRTANCSLDVGHQLPALRSECYPLIVKLTNLESADEMDKVRVTMVAPEMGRISLDAKMTTTSDGESPSMDLGVIEPSGTAVRTVFAQFDSPGSHQLSFRVDYQVKGAACSSTTLITIETVEPLDLTAQFQTMLHFQPLMKLPVEEDFMAVVTVTNRSPFTLLLDQGNWKWKKTDGGGGGGGVVVVNEPLPSQLVGLSLKPGEKASDVAVLSLSPSANSNNHKKKEDDEMRDGLLQVGSYSLKWKRLASASSSSSPQSVKIPYSACSYNLPPMETHLMPLKLDCILPAHGLVRKSMKALFVLTNNGPDCIQLDAAVTSNDAFMFAGNKQVIAAPMPFSNLPFRF